MSSPWWYRAPKGRAPLGRSTKNLLQGRTNRATHDKARKSAENDSLPAIWHSWVPGTLPTLFINFTTVLYAVVSSFHRQGNWASQQFSQVHTVSIWWIWDQCYNLPDSDVRASFTIEREPMFSPGDISGWRFQSMDTLPGIKSLCLHTALQIYRQTTESDCHSFSNIFYFK